MTDVTPAVETAVPEKWLRCNGQQYKKMVHAGLFWLEQNHQHVNALNVFPVPDGDTGTNMLLTMRAAYGRVQDKPENHVGKMADSVAQGALMGARGNSGVILSQIWRGLARSLKEQETFDAPALAQALQAAADTAYGGVMRPVEGTILTVIREGAAEAADAVTKSVDLRFVLDRVLVRCKQSLERTPDLLPILKQAGVVDSGGQGLVYVLEGMLRYVRGEIGRLEAAAAQADAVAPAAITAQELAMPESGHLENPYDVQFILTGRNLNVAEVRARIDAMGDSTVVVGDEATIKVHIHVKDPGQPLSYGISLGQVTDVVVENMQMQMEEIVHLGGGTTVLESLAEEAPPLNLKPGQVGVVAVAAGHGLGDIFRSLGAATVVNGGQSNNPSTEEIFQAIQDVPTDKVIILPNNKNIILTAEAARDLSPKSVAVVPTVTVPQGFNAMLAYTPDGELQATAVAMADSAREVATAEITRATRSVTLDGVTVQDGELIGLVNGRLCASGPDLTAVLTQVCQAMALEERELVSLYYGADVDPAAAARTAAQIEAAFPELEVETLSGGQPHYFYILGAE